LSYFIQFLKIINERKYDGYLLDREGNMGCHLHPRCKFIHL